MGGAITVVISGVYPSRNISYFHLDNYHYCTYLRIVHSITNPERIFETAGNEPILILCDDFNHYVCKYNRWPGQTAGKLIREYIAGRFGKLWNLGVPDFLFVRVSQNHIEDFSKLQPAFFSTLCFGSRYSNRYAEVDEFYS